MSRQVLINARLFDGQRIQDDAAVIVENEAVIEIFGSPSNLTGSDVIHDLEGRLLAPGLIDLQVNGGGGVLFNQDPTVDTIRRIGTAHRQFGTTGFLPTLISDTREKLRQAVHAVREARAQGVPGVLGIHVEGPWLNPEYCGIHDFAHFRPLDAQDIELLSAEENGRVVITLAPEVAGASAISGLAAAGIIVAAGHSGASYSQVQEALRAGLRGFTHLYNAMSPLATLQRGYSVLRTDGRTRDSQPKVISRRDQVSSGDRLEALLSDGRLMLSVESVDEGGLEPSGGFVDRPSSG